MKFGYNISNEEKAFDPLAYSIEYNNKVNASNPMNLSNAIDLPGSRKISHILRGPDAKQEFFDILRNVKGYVTIGSYKLHAGQEPDSELKGILTQLVAKQIDVKIIAEGRLTPQEIKGNTNLPVNTALNAFKGIGATVIVNLEQFKNVHAKFLFNDDVAVVSSTNYDFDPIQKEVVENKRVEKRDVSVVLKDKGTIDELKYVFGAIIAGKDVNWQPYLYDVYNLREGETRLTWPIQHREHISAIIINAKDNIKIYQQSLQDDEIVDLLVQQGDKVYVLMSLYPFGKKEGTPSEKNPSHQNLERLLSAGAHIKLTVEVHVHDKELVADGKIAYGGSANFYAPVLNKNGDNLNVGIITKDPEYIKDFERYFDKDWALSTNIDFKPGLYDGISF